MVCWRRGRDTEISVGLAGHRFIARVRATARVLQSVDTIMMHGVGDS
jgi:hypothetical protein